MANIVLSNGATVILDDEDYERLSRYRWHQHNFGYAYRYAGYRKETNGKIRVFNLYMHREVMKLGTGSCEVDHTNGNPLDNRKANLHKSDRSEQTINSRRPPNKSGWRGVAYCGSIPTLKSEWRAQIKIHGKMVYGRYFSSPRMAAFAYNDLALKHFGPQFRFFNQVFNSVKE